MIPVITSEIYLVLKGIDVNKAQGLDGFNNYFFRKAWNIVKGDIYKVVQEFFVTKALKIDQQH